MLEDKIDEYTKLSLKVTKLIANEKQIGNAVLKVAVVLLILIVICIANSVAKQNKIITSSLKKESATKLELFKRCNQTGYSGNFKIYYTPSQVKTIGQ